MRKIFILFMCIALFLISGCSPERPTNKELKELIYGIYLQDASIISKEECEGFTSENDSTLWLVFFRYDGNDNRPYGYRLERSAEGQLQPYGIPMLNATCPK